VLGGMLNADPDADGRGHRHAQRNPQLQWITVIKAELLNTTTIPSCNHSN